MKAHELTDSWRAFDVGVIAENDAAAAQHKPLDPVFLTAISAARAPDILERRPIPPLHLGKSPFKSLRRDP